MSDIPVRPWPGTIDETLVALQTQYQFRSEAIVPRHSQDAPTIEQICLIRDAHLNIFNILKELRALRAAVIILKDDAKVQVDDLIDTEFGFGFVTEVDGNNFNLALPTGERGVLKDGAWFRNFGQHKIIQRNGLPCVYESMLREGV